MRRTLVIMLGSLYIIVSLVGCAPARDKKGRADWERGEKWPAPSGKANIKTILEESKAIRERSISNLRLKKGGGLQ